MKRLFIGILVIFFSFAIIGCDNNSKSKDEPKNYIFNGDTDILTLTEGKITITDDTEIFNGGILFSTKENLNLAPEIDITFYVSTEEDYEILESVSTKHKNPNVPMSGDTTYTLDKLTCDGSLSNCNLYSPLFKNLVKDNFYVDIRVLYSDGTEVYSTMKLDVNELTD